jgi:hypothetical protein
MTQSLMTQCLMAQSLSIKGTAAGVLVGRFRGLQLKQMKLVVYQVLDEQMAQEQKGQPLKERST